MFIILCILSLGFVYLLSKLSTRIWLKMKCDLSSLKDIRYSNVILIIDKSDNYEIVFLISESFSEVKDEIISDFFSDRISNIEKVNPIYVGLERLNKSKEVFVSI